MVQVPLVQLTSAHFLCDLNINNPRHIELLRKEIISGLSSECRGYLWRVLTWTLQICEQHKRLYSRLLRHSSLSIVESISKDINRTFPNIPFFQCPSDYGQVGTSNVLRAYSQYDAEVGYCQGMPFIVGMLLMHLPDEVSVFWVFVHIMYGKNWRSMFKQGVPKLLEMIESLRRSLESHLLDVYKHFCEQRFNLNCFAGELMTLFSYKCRLDISIRIVDLFLLEGEHVLLNLLLKMIELKRGRLLQLRDDRLNLYCVGKLVNECLDEYPLEVLLSPIGCRALDEGDYCFL